MRLNAELKTNTSETLLTVSERCSLITKYKLQGKTKGSNNTGRTENIINTFSNMEKPFRHYSSVEKHPAHVVTHDRLQVEVFQHSFN